MACNEKITKRDAGINFHSIPFCYGKVISGLSEGLHIVSACR
jgi:hypothetical protein